LPNRGFDVRSQVSQESIAERQDEDDPKPSHFKRRKLRSNAIMYPTTEKKKESTDHS
jgi:hypothetical protein